MFDYQNIFQNNYFVKYFHIVQFSIDIKGVLCSGYI